MQKGRDGKKIELKIARENIHNSHLKFYVLCENIQGDIAN